MIKRIRDFTNYLDDLMARFEHDCYEHMHFGRLIAVYYIVILGVLVIVLSVIKLILGLVFGF